MTDRHAPPSFRGLGYYVPAIVVAFAVLVAVFLADVQKRRLEEEYLRSFTIEQLGLQGNILGNVKLVQGLVATLSTEPTMPPPALPISPAASSTRTTSCAASRSRRTSSSPWSIR